MPKRTFQPNRRRRSKTHGFRTRMKTKSGQAVLSRRRAKGRKRVSVKPGFREKSRRVSPLLTSTMKSVLARRVGAAQGGCNPDVDST